MATIIEMPKLSDTMTVGTLVKWLKKEGEEVTSGDVLAEVETDKATMELENFEEGVLLKQYVGEGDEVPLGAAVCAIGEKGEDAPEAPSASKTQSKHDGEEEEAANEEPKDGDDSEDRGTEEEPEAGDKAQGKAKKSAREEALEQPAASEKVAPSTPPTAASGERVKASPLARKLADEKGVDLGSLEGSGPGGRIVKADVLAAAERGSAQAPSKEESRATAAPASGPVQTLKDEEIKVGNMRGTIARRLLESKTTIPHFYLEMEVDAAPLTQMREAVNASLTQLPPEQGGMKLTVNDFILKATAEALRRVPAANASWQDKKIVRYGNVHLAFAVAIDEGLLTPVIRHAEQKTVRQIAAEVRALAKKARDKKLKPEEMSGSTFTTTNLGMFGIRNFYGIINPPNGAILAIGATEKKPIVNERDQIVIGHRMALGLSGDHRVVDGAVGAQFLVALREILETPALMMV